MAKRNWVAASAITLLQSICLFVPTTPLHSESLAQSKKIQTKDINIPENIEVQFSPIFWTDKDHFLFLALKKFTYQIYKSDKRGNIEHIADSKYNFFKSFKPPHFCYNRNEDNIYLQSGHSYKVGRSRYIEYAEIIDGKIAQKKTEISRFTFLAYLNFSTGKTSYKRFFSNFSCRWERHPGNSLISPVNSSNEYITKIGNNLGYLYYKDGNYNFINNKNEKFVLLSDTIDRIQYSTYRDFFIVYNGEKSRKMSGGKCLLFHSIDQAGKAKRDCYFLRGAHAKLPEKDWVIFFMKDTELLFDPGIRTDSDIPQSSLYFPNGTLEFEDDRPRWFIQHVAPLSYDHGLHRVQYTGSPVSPDGCSLIMFRADSADTVNKYRTSAREKPPLAMTLFQLC